jgi:hypothetical protein
MNLQQLLGTTLAAGAILLGLAQPAHAELVVINGDISDSPTYRRPVEDLSRLSNIGTAVSFDAIPFTVDTSGEYSLVASALGFDSFIVLYKNAFNPANGLLNAFAADDDLVSTNTSGFAASLNANQKYFLVLSGYDNDDAGRYSVTISGPGVISAVPEPAAWLMLGAGLAGLAYARRRQQRG